MVDVIPPGSGTSITTGTNDRKRTRDTGDKKTSSVQDHEESVKFFIRDIDNVEDMGGGGSSLTEAGSRKKKKKEKGGKSSSKAD